MTPVVRSAIASQSLQNFAEKAGLEAKEPGRAKFLLSQISEVLAPTNFLFSHSGGLRTAPTPDGVPVTMNGAIKEFRGSVEQLADAQVNQNVLARDAICDVIRDVAALSVSDGRACPSCRWCGNRPLSSRKL